MFNSNLIKNYATALFNQAVINSNEKIVLQDLQSISEMLSYDNRLLLVLSSPFFQKNHKTILMNDILNKSQISDITKHFINLLITQSRFIIFSYILTEYNNLYYKHVGIKSVSIIVAKQLEKNEEKKLVNYLSNFINGKLEIKFIYNPKIIGGFIAYYDNYLLDCSISGMLSKISNIII